MKKRVLSLLMAVAMCLSMLPATALAEELATGTDVELVEQPAPQEPEPAEEPGVPEGDPEKQETPPAPEREIDEAVKAVRALIDALPTEVTAENVAEIE